MAKIGTAHIELKPVLDEATLDAITERIAEAVAEGVRRGMEHPRLPDVVFDAGAMLTSDQIVTAIKKTRTALQHGPFREEY